jgi:hypothetical protein
MHPTKLLIPHKGMTWWRKKKKQRNATAGSEKFRSCLLLVHRRLGRLDLDFLSGPGIAPGALGAFPHFEGADPIRDGGWIDSVA